jgi:hypothetical protein
VGGTSLVLNQDGLQGFALLTGEGVQDSDDSGVGSGNSEGYGERDCGEKNQSAEQATHYPIL